MKISITYTYVLLLYMINLKVSTMTVHFTIEIYKVCGETDKNELSTAFKKVSALKM